MPGPLQLYWTEKMADLKEELTILAVTMMERDRFRDALIEIRDVAEISKDVQWYHMIAKRALDGGDT